MLGGLFFCACFSSVFAENSGLILSEIHPSEEYIEIQNISASAISVRGFHYSEETGSGFEKKYVFPRQDEVISAGEFFVIELSRKINDSGDTIRLYDSTDAKIAEISVPTKVSGKSYSLLSGEWKWIAPTKGRENFDSSEAENPENSGSVVGNANLRSLKGNSLLKISEILPNPVGKDADNEFIEIFNASENSVSLQGFSLSDKSGKIFLLTSSGNVEISGNSYLVFPYSQTKITLNNSDEEVFLKNENGEVVSAAIFSGASPEGQSFSLFGNGYQWTESVTNGEENILQISSSGGISGDSGNALFAEEKIEISEKREKKLVLKIQKIFPASLPDRVLVKCVECDASLEGIRLGIDGEVFRVPKANPEIFGKTGDILEFEFSNLSASKKRKRANLSQAEKNKEYEKTNQGWKFFVPQKGITATDETVYVGDENGDILDSIFYSNKNGYLPSSEKNEVMLLHAKKSWKGGMREFSGVSTVAINSKSFLKRRKNPEISQDLQDADSKKDFFRGFLTDDVEFDFPENSLPPWENEKIRFSGFTFSPEKLEISLENISNTPLVLSDFFLTNQGKFLVRLDEEQNILLPHQSLFITFPAKKLKFGKNSNLFLTIRDRNMDIFDVFCFEPTEKSARFRSRAYHNRFLSSPLEKKCFHIFSQKRVLRTEKKEPEISENFSLTRTNFSFPVALSSYILAPKFPENSSQDVKKPEISENSKRTKFPEILLNDSLPVFLSTAEISRKKEEEVQKKLALFREKFPVVISRVLPNPKGKDSGNEKVFLKNTSGQFVWLRDFSLKTSGRKYGKKLPYLVFAPHEEKEVQFLSGFSLKNSKEVLSLQRNSHEVIDSVSWKKARNNEFFGEFAPRYIAPLKKTKAKKSKKKKKQKNGQKKKSASDKASKKEKSKYKNPEISAQPLPDFVFPEKDNSFFLQKILWFAGGGFLTFFGISYFLYRRFWK